MKISYRQLERNYIALLEENRQLHNDLTQSKLILANTNAVFEKIETKHKGLVQEVIDELFPKKEKECQCTQESTQENQEQLQSSETITTLS